MKQQTSKTTRRRDIRQDQVYKDRYEPRTNAYDINEEPLDDDQEETEEDANKDYYKTNLQTFWPEFYLEEYR